MIQPNILPGNVEYLAQNLKLSGILFYLVMFLKLISKPCKMLSNHYASKFKLMSLVKYLVDGKRNLEFLSSGICPLRKYLSSKNSKHYSAFHFTDVVVSSKFMILLK